MSNYKLIISKLQLLNTTTKTLYQYHSHFDIIDELMTLQDDNKITNLVFVKSINQTEYDKVINVEMIYED